MRLWNFIRIVIIFSAYFLGHVFANLPHNEKFASETMAKDDDEEDDLLINVIEEGNAMLQNLQILNMQVKI